MSTVERVACFVGLVMATAIGVAIVAAVLLQGSPRAD